MTTNHYQAPQSQLDVAAAEGFGDIKPLSASGRLGRLRYIAYSFGFTMLAMLVLGVLSALAAPMGDSIGTVIVGLAVIAVYVALLVVGILLTIQRCHDFNASGWFSLLMFVPLVSLIFWFMPGTKGPNRFGRQPPPNRVLVTLVAMIIPAVMILGILAALAIPAYQDYVERARAAQEQMR